ncbi:hypothetical protein M1555_00245 [Patescibacteria group bacterium]|nr:hypothetical protein [Patescibacteria group bacterium]
MESRLDINLINAKADVTPEVAALSRLLHRLSIMSLALLVPVAAGMSIVLIVLRARLTSLQSERQQLVTAISGLSQTEGLYTALQDRVGVTEKVAESQVDWSQAMDLVDAIRSDTPLSSVTVNDSKSVLVNIEVSSVDALVPVMSRLTEAVTAKKINHPVLRSFQYNKDGSMLVSLQFSLLL